MSQSQTTIARKKTKTAKTKRNRSDDIIKTQQKKKASAALPKWIIDESKVPVLPSVANLEEKTHRLIPESTPTEIARRILAQVADIPGSEFVTSYNSGEAWILVSNIILNLRLHRFYQHQDATSSSAAVGGALGGASGRGCTVIEAVNLRGNFRAVVKWSRVIFDSASNTDARMQETSSLSAIPPPLPLTADSLQKAIRENPQASISPSLVRESGLVRASRLSPQPQYGVFETDNPRTLHLQNDPDIAFIEDSTKTPFLIEKKKQLAGEIMFAVVAPQFPSTMSFPQKVAIKRTSKSFYLTKAENPLAEALLMKMDFADNVHVLRCCEVLQTNSDVFSIMPRCEYDLWEWRKDEKRPKQRSTDGMIVHVISEQKALPIFKNILDCLAHLQKHSIRHNDLSLENFMRYEGRFLMIDFGYASDVKPDNPRKYLPTVGKRPYMAPERCNTEVYKQWFGKAPDSWTQNFFEITHMDGYGSDLWSAGIILFFLLTDKFPYERPLDEEFMKNIRNKTFGSNFFEPNQTVVVDLLSRILEPDPNRRIKLEAIYEHPWVNKQETTT